jgi:tRNA dimethylallyltransferase
MIEEVKNLRKKGVNWKRLDDLGLEYRYISRYLRGLLKKEEMIEILNKESYQYAKRQMTWFKRDKNIHWIDPAKNQNEAIGLVKKFTNN